MSFEFKWDRCAQGRFARRTGWGKELNKIGRKNKRAIRWPWLLLDAGMCSATVSLWIVRSALHSAPSPNRLGIAPTNPDSQPKRAKSTPAKHEQESGCSHKTCPCKFINQADFNETNMINFCAFGRENLGKSNRVFYGFDFGRIVETFKRNPLLIFAQFYKRQNFLTISFRR